MRKFFVFVFAVTLAVIVAIGIAVGTWWYVESRPPNLELELFGYMDIEREEQNRLAFIVNVTNHDSEDYIAGPWTVLPVREDGVIFPAELEVIMMESNRIYSAATTLAVLLTEVEVEALWQSPDGFKDAPTVAGAEEFLRNLERVEDALPAPSYLFINEDLKLRQRISLKDFIAGRRQERNELLEKAKAEAAE